MIRFCTRPLGGALRGRVIGGLALLALGMTVMVMGQRRWGREFYYRADQSRTAREIPTHSSGTPNWTNAPGFTHDVFTFVRIRYNRGGYGWGSAGNWTTDLPDSDLNLSYRLQQMTSMKVDPDGRILDLTDPELVQFPFIYIVEPGGLELDEAEASALRHYLLNGGFLMLDDFWGEREWANCEREMRRVFPDRDFSELPLSHPLYQAVFSIHAKYQVPNVGLGVESQWSKVTWERPDAREVHHRVIYDDRQRIMVMATHNTDNGDGWEREGENDYYFFNFSEKTAYPLGINLIFYAMTH
jgi:hypothetical protein